MKKQTNPEDVLFTIAAVMGVTIIVLFGVSSIAKLIIHLIK
jgi:hypothetical protein